MNAKHVQVVAAVVIVAIGVSYMLFLAYTWQQMQRDRTDRFARVDAILDKMKVTEDDSNVTDS